MSVYIAGHPMTRIGHSTADIEFKTFIPYRKMPFTAVTVKISDKDSGGVSVSLIHRGINIDIDSTVRFAADDTTVSHNRS